MRPVRHRRFSEDSTSVLKKCIHPSSILSDIDPSDKTHVIVKNGKKTRISHVNSKVLTSKNGVLPFKLKGRDQQEHQNHVKDLKVEKCPVPKRQKKNELSILIDANIEHYSGRRRRGSIDMKAQRVTKTSALESPKKETDLTPGMKRELRNGREANYLVDESDEESPPPKKKFKKEAAVPVKIASTECEAKISKKAKPIKVVAIKKEVFSDESLDAPAPPRKKPRNFRGLKSKLSPVPVMPNLSSETGYQSEFVKSVLLGRNLPSKLPNCGVGMKEKRVSKDKSPRKKRVSKLEENSSDELPLIPAHVPAPAFSQTLFHDSPNKMNPFAPYPMIEETGVNQLTKYSFESLPQTEVWFHTYLRQDMRFEQNRIHNVYQVTGGSGFSFELPYEMPISRIITKVSNKTPLKKANRIDLCKQTVSVTPRRLLRHPGEISADKVCDDSEASDYSNNVSVCTTSEALPDEQQNVSKPEEIAGTETPISNFECPDLLEKRPKHLRKGKPCFDDFARKSPRCHASTLAILSELRHKLNSDAEDSQSESGESRHEDHQERVNIISFDDVESILTRPLENLSLMLKEEFTVTDNMEYTAFDFDEIFDMRELENYTFDPSRLPALPGVISQAVSADSVLSQISLSTGVVSMAVSKVQDFESCDNLLSNLDSAGSLVPNIEPLSSKEDGCTLLTKKRDRYRRRANATGWPKSKRKPPSRASTASSESQDSRTFLTPLPVECFDSEMCMDPKVESSCTNQKVNGFHHDLLVTTTGKKLQSKRLKRTLTMTKNK